jgi:phosphoserine aminotransferase
MYNTPPTYAIYMAGLVFKWLKEQGGLVAIEQRNMVKARTLYDYFDQSDFYTLPVHPSVRSRMNAPFFLRDASLDSEFLKGAQQRGLMQLKGHKSVGGMRASIYNAMPLEGVLALIDYLKDFERSHG